MQCDWNLKVPRLSLETTLQVVLSNYFAPVIQKLTLGIRSGLVTEITLIMWLDSGDRKSLECCKKGLISHSGRPWREHRDKEAWLLMLP